MPDGGPLQGSPVSADEFDRCMMASLRQGAQPVKIAVAVSGGADSMALCLLAHDWAAANGIALTALTVDHGLRTGSAAEARQVGAWLAARGIAHEILTWNSEAQITSRLQERARNARYALMRGWCLEHSVGHLLAAHHLEDQAETVLMRLKKGSGLLGLAGMARGRDLDGIHLVRPLLAVAKARLRDTLKSAGQDWVEDPSNENQRFERVRTRFLLAELEREGISAARLAGAAQSVGRVRDVLDAAADALIGNAVEGSSVLHVDAQAFANAPQTVQRLALTKLLAAVGGGAYPPARMKLDRLLRWMVAGHGQARTLGGCVVRRSAKVLAKTETFLISAESPRKCS